MYDSPMKIGVGRSIFGQNRVVVHRPEKAVERVEIIGMDCAQMCSPSWLRA